MGKKLQGGIVALALLTIIGGYVLSFFQKEDNSKHFGKPVNLSLEERRQIKETLLKENGEVSDQQILKMIGHDIRQAEVCWDCNEFQEQNSSSLHTAYPVVGHRVQQGEVRYTLIVGQILWYAGSPMKMWVIPKTAIYAEKKDITYRITDADEMMYIDKSGGWLWSRVSYVSVQDKLRRDAIAALQKPIIQTF